MEKNIYRDGEYLKNNPNYHLEDSRWKAQHILKMINKHNLEPNTVCEIGCGTGEILRQLQIYMPDTTSFVGYDISPQAYELCKQRENEKLAFHCEDILDQQIEPFDIILCIDVFEHVEDYMGFLRKLRHKGKLKIFHIPLELSVIKIFRHNRLLTNRSIVGHLHYFIKDTALLTLKDTGYEIVDYFYTPSGLYNRKGLRIELEKKLPHFFNLDTIARIFGRYSLLVLTT